MVILRQSEDRAVAELGFSVIQERDGPCVDSDDLMGYALDSLLSVSMLPLTEELLELDWVAR